MKIPPSPAEWATRLQYASNSVDRKSGVVRIDPAKIAAADSLHTSAVERLHESATASPLERAQAVWRSRGHHGIPTLAARTVVDGPDEDFRILVAAADRETLADAIDEVALRVLALEGREQALSRLLDLKVICDAGSRLVPEYNRRMRSTPAQRRGEPLPAELEQTLEVLQDRLQAIRDEVQNGTFLGRVRQRAGALSEKLFEAGRNTIQRFRGEEGEKTFLSSVWDKVKLVGSHLVPGPIQRGLAAVSDSATELVAALTDVEDDQENLDALVDRLVGGVAAARATIDPDADAIAVGLMGETTAGVIASSGHELVYLREQGKLRLNRVDGTGARIGVGGSLRAYTTNAYGPSEALSGSAGRSSLEVGAVVANLSFNRGHAGDEAGGRSFSTVFAVGLTASLPFLDGQAVSTITENNLETYDLRPEHIERLEAEIAQVPPRARRWTNFLGRMVGKNRVGTRGRPEAPQLPPG